MQGSTYTQPWHYEEIGWLVLRSATFTFEESSRYSIYRRLTEPQDHSGRKISTLSTPGIENGPSSPLASVKGFHSWLRDHEDDKIVNFMP